jgi:anaerobic magnesium-protoporphyrin IX monomethyl ester cyclase
VRITFVIPPSGFLLDQLVFPTLGCLKVAAVLEQAGQDVDVLDLTGVADPEGMLAKHLREPADVYAFTATMPQMPSTAIYAELVRELAPTAKRILGGPHVTLMQSSARHETKQGKPGRACYAIRELMARFDVLVCGDGEKAIGRALLPHAAPLIDADNLTSDLFLTNAGLEESPFPARHLIDLNRYHYMVDGERTQSLICQLGCPFGCTFCGGRKSPFLRKVRTRSAASVVAEMRQVYEQYQTRGFMFFDDELNVNKMFIDLLAEIRGLQDQLGVEFRLRGFLKAELLTVPMAAAMHRAGFRQVLVGIESGHPRILKNIQKQATREDNTRAVEVLHNAGITVKAAISVGHPGETVDTIGASLDWLLEARPDDFDVSLITVYPGTPYFDESVETTPGIWTYTAPNGDRLHSAQVDHLSDVNFYKGIPHHYQSFVSTDALSAEQMCALRDDLEAEARAQMGIPYQDMALTQHDHSMGVGL